MSELVNGAKEMSHHIMLDEIKNRGLPGYAWICSGMLGYFNQCEEVVAASERARKRSKENELPHNVR